MSIHMTVHNCTTQSVLVIFPHPPDNHHSSDVV